MSEVEFSKLLIAVLVSIVIYFLKRFVSSIDRMETILIKFDNRIDDIDKKIILLEERKQDKEVN